MDKLESSILHSTVTDKLESLSYIYPEPCPGEGGAGRDDQMDLCEAAQVRKVRKVDEIRCIRFYSNCG